MYLKSDDYAIYDIFTSGLWFESVVTLVNNCGYMCMADSP